MIADPTRRITIPELSEDEQAELDDLIAQWRAKRPRNSLRAAHYDAKNARDALLQDNAIPPRIKRRSFVLGWSAKAVDSLNRRCNLEGFYADGIDLDSLGLNDLVRANRLDSELSQAGASSLIHSVAWLITTQGDTKKGEPEVLVTARDALTGTGIWDPRRRAVRSFLSLTDFDDQGEPVGMTMYLDNVNIVMEKDAGAWSVDRREHVYGVPVDPLRYKPRLGRPFGSSRITRTVMSLQQQAIAAMIRADVNGEAYSMPRYILLGADESAFQNADGSMKPTWQAAWDAVWAIGDDEDAANPRADVKQFSGQSPEPQNAHLRMLAQMFSGETAIPIGELGIIGDANPTSAEAYLAARETLIGEAEGVTDDWKPDLSSAMTRALRMLNRGDVPDDLEVRPHFRSPQYVSRAAAADAGTKIIDKMPWLAETEVGMELMGLTDDQIRRALAERRRATGTTALSSILDRVAAQVTDGNADDATA